MFRKIVVFILISTALFSHKIQGIKLEAEKIKNDSILIKAYFQKSKKQLVGNKVKLISKIDNRRLNQTYIKEGKNTVLQIPKEPYWIFLYVGKQDVVIEGPPPSLGFLSKEDRDNKLALKVTGSLTLLFLLFSFIIGSRRSIKYNSSN